MSAASVFRYMDRSKYEVVPIGITKTGKWLLADDALKMLETGIDEGSGTPVAIVPEPSRRALVATDESARRIEVGGLDVVFPVLHGTYGEDGTVQGLLELADIPYVGSGVLASSVGMDKDVMKRLFRERGLPVPRFEVVSRRDIEAGPVEVVARLTSSLRLPLFVKPANLGSSVGVTKVADEHGLEPALREACLYDRKVIVEEAVTGAREIECAVLGNDDPIASPPGEVVPAREFYDYVAKYLDPNTQLIVPADLPAEVSERVRSIAVKAFKCVDASGMARVDFFVERESLNVWLNEINTIPGFTSVSMYPKMMEAAGIPYTELISRLIELAIERHAEKSRRLTTYHP
jgi:D-alanine-D-alanine ligase